MLHRAWESWSGNLEEYLFRIQQEFMSIMITNILDSCPIFCLCVWHSWSDNLKKNPLKCMSHEYHDRLFVRKSFKNKAKYMSTMIPQFLENLLFSTWMYENNDHSIWNFQKVQAWGVSTMIRTSIKHYYIFLLLRYVRC